jgi:ankyrin repeat protein
VEADARLIARTANGYTALHMAAQRGDAEMIKIILERSERNEAEHEEKEMTKKDERKRARNAESTQDISKEAASAEDRESQQPR